MKTICDFQWDVDYGEKKELSNELTNPKDYSKLGRVIRNIAKNKAIFEECDSESDIKKLTLKTMPDPYIIYRSEEAKMKFSINKYKTYTLFSSIFMSQQTEQLLSLKLKKSEFSLVEKILKQHFISMMRLWFYVKFRIYFIYVYICVYLTVNVYILYMLYVCL